MAQNGNGKKGSGLNKGCYLFVVFIFAILLSLAIFLGYLYFEGSLDAFKQDPVKWFSGEIKDEPTVEPIPPITPPAQEIESIEPNDVVPFELTDTPYPGFG